MSVLEREWCSSGGVAGGTSERQQETHLLQPQFKVLIQGELVLVVQEKVS